MFNLFFFINLLSNLFIKISYSIGILERASCVRYPRFFYGCCVFSHLAHEWSSRSLACKRIRLYLSVVSKFIEPTARDYLFAPRQPQYSAMALKVDRDTAERFAFYAQVARPSLGDSSRTPPLLSSPARDLAPSRLHRRSDSFIFH